MEWWVWFYWHAAQDIGLPGGELSYVLTYRKSRYSRGMELIEIFKALSNPTRLQILKGLKDPAKNFPPQDEGDVLTVGVCVSSIQEGIGLSQSTVSGYLATLQRVGLVEVRRVGQWTYYKRNEATIRALAEVIGKEL